MKPGEVTDRGGCIFQVGPFAPGASSAGDSITLPTGSPPLAAYGSQTGDLAIEGAYTLTLEEAGPNTIAQQALTPTAFATGAPAANQIMQVDENKVKIGNDTITSTLLVVIYRTGVKRRTGAKA